MGLQISEADEDQSFCEALILLLVGPGEAELGESNLGKQKLFQLIYELIQNQNKGTKRYERNYNNVGFEKSSRIKIKVRKGMKEIIIMLGLKRVFGIQFQ